MGPISMSKHKIKHVQGKKPQGGRKVAVPSLSSKFLRLGVLLDFLYGFPSIKTFLKQ